MRLNVPHGPYPRVVIIGGGFAGITLAQKLFNKNYQVVMIDKNNYHTFQPLLYQVATGGLEPDSIAYPLRKIFKHSPNVHFRMAEVLEINSKEKRITTNIGVLRYDYLVIATGSTTNFFNNSGIMEHGMPLKSIPEALDLRSLLLQNFEKALFMESEEERSALLQVLIVGAGPTGVELAGALGELKKHVLPSDYSELNLDLMKVTLVQSRNRVLNDMDEKSSESALKGLIELGVEVLNNDRVIEYDGEYAKLKSGRTIHTKSLVWTAGVEGSLIKGLDKAKIIEGNRFLVDDYNYIVGYPDIFAIGDVAGMKTELCPEPHSMVAPVAIQQAQLLAENFSALQLNQPLKPFKYFHKGSMATIGRNKAVVDIGKLHLSGFWAWLSWMFLHLVMLVGYRNKLVVLINWIISYFSYDRGVRLIIKPFIKRLNNSNPNKDWVS